MKKVQLTLAKAQMKMHDFLANDRGDTNFISIMIVLGIVLAVAIVFISFKDQIVGAASEQINTFLASFG